MKSPRRIRRGFLRLGTAEMSAFRRLLAWSSTGLLGVFVAFIILAVLAVVAWYLFTTFPWGMY
jgi:ribose/xylose/arabinose/galactoside ABC-type transport system permease subunit